MIDIRLAVTSDAADLKNSMIYLIKAKVTRLKGLKSHSKITAKKSFVLPRMETN